MNIAIKIVRLLGCLAGVWLLASSASGIPKVFSFFSLSYSIRFSLHVYGPPILLGVLLLLPWSQIRSFALWAGAFVVMLSAGTAYLWREFLPFTVVWRPSVLLDAGILQRLLLSLAFVLIQVIVIAFLRFRAKSNEPTTAVPPQSMSLVR